MSQICMTAGERVQALRRFGYSEPEAGFLCLAALHGGYFLRRQYALFIGGKDGGTVTQLVQKALANGHLQASTWRQNTQLYHLCARPFYEALGQGENRNRRVREVVAVKNKLMGFDFVLAHRGLQYLATEEEKLNYFAGELKLDRSRLPAKLYRSSKSSAAATARYFVDKYPTFLSPATQEASPGVVSFCFVDEGMASLSRFESYLAQYRSLLCSLQGFRLVYVAASDVHFKDAERRFHGFLQRSSGSNPDIGSSPDGRLRNYFETRHLYESGQLASFDRAKLLRLRQEREEFSNDMYEAQYSLWQSGAGSATLESLVPQPTTPPSIPGIFSTFLLEHNYELFGRFLG